MSSSDNTSTRKRDFINRFVNNGWFILACNLCSVIGLVISFVSENEICKIIFAIITALLICSVAFYMFYRVFALKRAKRNIYKTNLAMNKKTFGFLHDFYKDLLAYIYYLRNNDNISKETFRDKAILLCNRIERIFTIYLATKEPVSVCVKLIKSDSIMDENILNSEVYTFARSTSTASERFQYDEKDNSCDKINNNSDFEMIVSNEDAFRNIDYFSCEDLDAYPKIHLEEYKKEYRNSHSEPPYKSAIVIPIRAKIENVSKNLKRQCVNKNCFHIVGFLCIDSEEKFITSKDFKLTRFKSSTELAYTLGESLYPFFEEHLIKSL